MSDREEAVSTRRRRPARFVPSKFVVPEAVSPEVLRPELVERFERVGPTALRLVVAPAGPGKTTILRQWVRQRPPGPTCWMQADRADGLHPLVFAGDAFGGA